MTKSTDVLGAHGAGYDKPPTASTQQSIAENNGCPVFTFRRVEDLRAVMERNGDAAKQVWLLEFGWTTDTVHPDRAFYAVTPEVQGQYLVDAFKYAKANWSPWIGIMTVIYIPSPDWTAGQEQFYWSITNPDGTLRPAYEALKAMPRIAAVPPPSASPSPSPSPSPASR